MQIKFLGTGAAEGIPALFCHCNICKHARENGGRNVRTRSQAIIDNKILLDFGPDTYLHSLKYDIELADIEHCLITHSHDDHLYLEDLRARRRSRANLRPGTPPLNVYGGSGVKECLKPNDEGYVTKDQSVLYKEVSPFVSYDINGYKILPIAAVHGTSQPLVYAISKEDRTILYGHDTDYFTEDSWKELKKMDIHFDLVSLDCTEGKKHIDYPGHMNFERMNVMCERMRKEKMISDKTIIIANHISHNGLITYEEAVELGKENGYIISYDGMEMEI